MTVIDPNTNTVVSTSTDTQTSEFTREEIVAKAMSVVKDNSLVTVDELLQDESFQTLVVSLLQKEKQDKKASIMKEAKQKLEQMLKVPAPKPVIVDTTEARISRMVKYQQDTFSVLSPKFVFDNVDTAASWRRYLINFIIGLRNLMKVVDKTDLDWKLLASKADFLQKHIDAADAVLEGFWKVTADYRTQVDMRKQVEMEVFMNSEHQQYQDLVQDMATTIDSFRAKYTNNAGHRADEGGQTPQTSRPNGKKKGKHARNMPHD